MDRSCHCAHQESHVALARLDVSRFKALFVRSDLLPQFSAQRP